ncbi:hypothetical protein MC885_013743, partial [Smutsia gigantea]
IGAGGSITGLKFNPLNTKQFFTSSMEGTTKLQDFTGNTLQVFASSGTCKLKGAEAPSQPALRNTVGSPCSSVISFGPKDGQ